MTEEKDQWEETKVFGWVGKCKFVQIKKTTPDGTITLGYVIQPHYKDFKSEDLRPKKGGVWLPDSDALKDAIYLLRQMMGEIEPTETEKPTTETTPPTDVADTKVPPAENGEGEEGW